MVTIQDNDYFKTTMNKHHGLILITQLDKVDNTTEKIRLTMDKVIVLEKALRKVI